MMRRRLSKSRRSYRRPLFHNRAFVILLGTTVFILLFVLRRSTTRGPETDAQRPAAPGVAMPSSPGEKVWGGILEGIPRKPRSEMDIHVVFSTDCSPYQNYQSLLLFHSAETMGQGPVTRVASGCTAEEQEELVRLMDLQPPRFRVHFTPDYSIDAATGKRFPFYNKPNGMAHFLRHADPPVEEAVIALVDPDMVFMSTLRPYVGDWEMMLWRSPSGEDGPEWVEEGYPVGQYYGLGGLWTSWGDLKDIAQGLGRNSPALKMNAADAVEYYSVGPPYMMHPRDWARVIDLWVKMCPEVYQRHEGILAEMYGFCIGAAHIGLRHRVASGLMVSDSKMPNAEGWPLVELLGDEVCDPAAVERQRRSLPPISHFCQMYRVGTFMFGKRQPSLHDFFSCDSDFLELPPADLLSSEMARLRVHPTKIEVVDSSVTCRQGYIMCGVIKSLNDALESFKDRYCREDERSGGTRRFTDLTANRLKQAEAEIAEMISEGPSSGAVGGGRKVEEVVSGLESDSRFQSDDDDDGDSGDERQ